MHFRKATLVDCLVVFLNEVFGEVEDNRLARHQNLSLLGVPEGNATASLGRELVGISVSGGFQWGRGDNCVSWFMELDAGLE